MTTAIQEEMLRWITQNDGELIKAQMGQRQIDTAESLVKTGLLRRTPRGYAIPAKGRFKKVSQTLKVIKTLTRDGVPIFNEDERWAVVSIQGDGRIAIRRVSEKKLIRLSTYEANFKAV